MDSKGNPIVGDEVEANLEFQNFGLSHDQQNFGGNVRLNNNAVNSASYSFSAPNPQQQPGRTALATEVSTTSYSFWNFEYYSHYFNVDTKDVIARISCAAVPKSSFFDFVGDNADLYGPVWIPTTVIFALFVTSSIAKSIAAYINGDSTDNIDYNLLSYACGTVYAYSFAVPIFVWAVAKWFSVPLSWLSLTSLYGYGMSVWVPVSIACIAPFEWVRWLLVAIAYFWSVTFMLRAIVPVAANCSAQSKLIVVVLVSALHFVLVVLFKLWFFQYVIKVSNST